MIQFLICILDRRAHITETLDQQMYKVMPFPSFKQSGIEQTTQRKTNNYLECPDE